ncbi:glycoside hydrolase N-terminal domain-containing protein [Streptomyces sp. SP17BM10]|uniref:glycoside hydrolase N-terminal domain-containing protein n=1 Tax=Streptomyces sp. SP17BM10 TaxID=3002530 RepID=UPI002E7A9557|nr:glycoside hydrolase N-terminal domain-containing protein [Streptomyces sp. SP17BM10]MEE1784526.1 glycoside hydrolase N-terminal domain-containing protein [Streptomyces sp. SP17BM10]
MPTNTHEPATDPLWCRRPADGFLEALPLGNGTLGAVTYGGVHTERIELNADTPWSGGPGPRDRAGAADHLSAPRRAVRARDHPGAHAISATHFQGPDSEAYQPLGTLLLIFPSSDEGLQRWTATGGTNQQRYPQPTGDGYFTIVSHDGGLMADDYGWDTTDGAKAVRYGASGGSNLPWQPIPA